MQFNTFLKESTKTSRAERKSTVAKSLRLNGCNLYSNGLKAPTSLITSVHTSKSVFSPLNLRAPTWEETEGAMQRIRNLYSQILSMRFLRQSSCEPTPNLPVSHAGESWNNTSQGNARREKRLGSKPFWFTLHSEKIASKHPKQNNRGGFVLALHSNAIQKTTVYSRAASLSLRFNLGTHTCEKSSIHPQRWMYVCIVAQRDTLQLLPLLPTTTFFFFF